MFYDNKTLLQEGISGYNGHDGPDRSLTCRGRY
jgi:hypothetical protein